MTYRFIPHDAPRDAKGVKYVCLVDVEGYLRVRLLNNDGEWRAVWSLSPSGFPHNGPVAFTPERLSKHEFPMEGTP